MEIVQLTDVLLTALAFSPTTADIVTATADGVVDIAAASVVDAGDGLVDVGVSVVDVEGGVDLNADVVIMKDRASVDIADDEEEDAAALVVLDTRAEVTRDIAEVELVDAGCTELVLTVVPRPTAADEVPDFDDELARELVAMRAVLVAAPPAAVAATEALRPLTEMTRELDTAAAPRVQ